VILSIYIVEVKAQYRGTDRKHIPPYSRHVPSGYMTFSNLCLCRVPLYAVLELDARAAKDVQRATDGQIHFALAQFLHQL
jgi:hypothetical protein